MQWEKDLRHCVLQIFKICNCNNYKYVVAISHCAYDTVRKDMCQYIKTRV